jgi:hypothetical protein
LVIINANRHRPVTTRHAISTISANEAPINGADERNAASYLPHHSSLALPTHHDDMESLGFSLRDLSLQFGLALLAPPNGGDWLVSPRSL